MVTWIWTSETGRKIEIQHMSTETITVDGTEIERKADRLAVYLDGDRIADGTYMIDPRHGAAIISHIGSRRVVVKLSAAPADFRAFCEARESAKDSRIAEEREYERHQSVMRRAMEE